LWIVFHSLKAQIDRKRFAARLTSEPLYVTVPIVTNTPLD
jgi:hypothetical protein